MIIRSIRCLNGGRWVSILLAALLLWGLGNRSSAQVFGIATERDIVAMYLFNGQDEAGYRKMIEGRATLQIKQLAAAVALDAGGMEKLELAAQGDVSRFFRKIADVQQATKGFSMQNQNDMQKAWELIMPLQQEVAAGLFEGNSLFQRVLQSSLNAEQRQAYDEYMRLRKAAEIEALLKITISEVERSIPLVAKQRKELLRLLREQPTPKSYPEGYGAYVGFVILTRVEPRELETFLDEQQVKAFGALKQLYAGYEQAFKW